MRNIIQTLANELESVGMQEVIMIKAVLETMLFPYQKGAVEDICIGRQD